jgi:nucleotide-binding universal stress UspA family protein
MDLRIPINEATMIKRVLIPLDGSQLAEKALPIARQVVQSGGEIILMTAAHDAVPLINLDPDSPAASEDAAYVQSAAPRAQEYLEHIGRNLQLNGYQVSIEVVGGEPADAIIAVAEQNRVEMVIMSTHGRSGLSRVLFGSITLKVLETASMPVLVVPNREREEVSEPAIVPDLGTDPVT